MREIKIRQRWASIEERLPAWPSVWTVCERNVVVVSISGNIVVVFNVETLRKSTLKKKTLNDRFLYVGMMRKNEFKSLLKERERSIK